MPTDIYRRLTSVVKSTDAGRGSANVNVSGASRTEGIIGQGSSAGFRRLSSTGGLPGARLLMVPLRAAGVQGLSASARKTFKPESVMPDGGLWAFRVQPGV